MSPNDNILEIWNRSLEEIHDHLSKEAALMKVAKEKCLYNSYISIFGYLEENNITNPNEIWNTVHIPTLRLLQFCNTSSSSTELYRSYQVAPYFEKATELFPIELFDKLLELYTLPEFDVIWSSKSTSRIGILFVRALCERLPSRSGKDIKYQLLNFVVRRCGFGHQALSGKKASEGLFDDLTVLGDGSEALALSPPSSLSASEEEKKKIQSTLKKAIHKFSSSPSIAHQKEPLSLLEDSTAKNEIEEGEDCEVPMLIDEQTSSSPVPPTNDEENLSSSPVSALSPPLSPPEQEFFNQVFQINNYFSNPEKIMKLLYKQNNNLSHVAELSSLLSLLSSLHLITQTLLEKIKSIPFLLRPSLIQNKPTPLSSPLLWETASLRGSFWLEFSSNIAFSLFSVLFSNALPVEESLKAKLESAFLSSILLFDTITRQMEQMCLLDLEGSVRGLEGVLKRGQGEGGLLGASWCLFEVLNRNNRAELLWGMLVGEEEEGEERKKKKGKKGNGGRRKNFRKLLGYVAGMKDILSRRAHLMTLPDSSNANFATNLRLPFTKIFKTQTQSIFKFIQLEKIWAVTSRLGVSSLLNSDEAMKHATDMTPLLWNRYLNLLPSLDITLQTISHEEKKEIVEGGEISEIANTEKKKEIKISVKRKNKDPFTLGRMEQAEKKMKMTEINTDSLTNETQGVLSTLRKSLTQGVLMKESTKSKGVSCDDNYYCFTEEDTEAKKAEKEKQIALQEQAVRNFLRNTEDSEELDTEMVKKLYCLQGGRGYLLDQNRGAESAECERSHDLERIINRTEGDLGYERQFTVGGVGIAKAQAIRLLSHYNTTSVFYNLMENNKLSALLTHTGNK